MTPRQTDPPCVVHTIDIDLGAGFNVTDLDRQAASPQFTALIAQGYSVVAQVLVSINDEGTRTKLVLFMRPPQPEDVDEVRAPWPGWAWALLGAGASSVLGSLAWVLLGGL